MIFAFTGPRHGMTPRQYEAFKHLVLAWAGGYITFLNGACAGADSQAFNAARVYSTCAIELYPSTSPTWNRVNALRREATHMGARLTIHPEQAPMERDRVMVERCSVLIAAPQMLEPYQSGTFSTMQMARMRGKPVLILDP